MDQTVTKRCRLTGVFAVLLLLPHCQRPEPAAMAAPRESGNNALHDTGPTPCPGSVAACDPRLEPDPEPCSRGGWCWKIPTGPNDSYQDAWAVDDTNVLAVGPPEFILHWSGETRRYLPSGTSSVLHAVWAAHGADAWAVGEAGAIVHWNGSRWSQVRSGGPTLNAVFGTGPSDVWAGGDEGSLLHWNGVQWLPVPTGMTATIRSLWASGPTDLWVSTPGLGVEETLRRWNGQSWSLQPSVEGYVNGLWGFGPHDVWVSGSSGLLAHWTGEAWHTLPGADPEDSSYEDPGDSFMGMRGLDSSRLWLVGTGLWRFDGEVPHRQKYDTLGVNRLASVAMGSQGPLLAVGSTGLLLRPLEQEQWETLPQPLPLNTSFRSLWASGSTDAWAVHDTQGLFHWDGVAWDKVQGAPPMQTFVISGSAPSDVWAGGRMLGTFETTLAHFDGSQWTKTLFPRGETFVGVWAPHADAAWAASSRGVIRRWNGQSWQESVNLGLPLTGLHGSSDDNVWVVGEGGTLLQWNGQQWVNHSFNGPGLEAVWVFGPEDVWAAGQDHVFWHWDGRQIQRVDAGVSTVMVSLFGRSPNDLWAVGGLGVILHWDGRSWTSVSSGTRHGLRTLSGAGGRLFVGGDGPVILQHD